MAILNDAPVPSLTRQQHIALSKEQTTTRYPITLDLAGGHPSVDGANLDPAQLRDFALRQQLFARSRLVPHTPSPPFDLGCTIRRPRCRVAQLALSLVIHCSEIAPGVRTRDGAPGRTGAKNSEQGRQGRRQRAKMAGIFRSITCRIRNGLFGSMTIFCSSMSLERHSKRSPKMTAFASRRRSRTSRDAAWRRS